MGGACSTYGERGGAKRTLMKKSECKKQLERSRCRWEDNTKINLEEVEWVIMDWIDLFHVRRRWRALVNAVMNLRVP
jgi:hypothetical protein